MCPNCGDIVLCEFNLLDGPPRRYVCAGIRSCEAGTGYSNEHKDRGWFTCAHREVKPTPSGCLRIGKPEPVPVPVPERKPRLVWNKCKRISI